MDSRAISDGNQDTSVADPVTKAKPSISVVVPVYNSELILPDLIKRLGPVLAQICSDYEVVFVNDASRTVRVRVEIENPGFKLRPGMYVNIALEHSPGEGVAVPVSAVLPTGGRNVVFVDKGGGRLEPRFVELGRKYGDDYAVKSGLTVGERVVNSANFLIDAESKVQGALKSW